MLLESLEKPQPPAEERVQTFGLEADPSDKQAQRESLRAGRRNFPI